MAFALMLQIALISTAGTTFRGSVHLFILWGVRGNKSKNLGQLAVRDTTCVALVFFSILDLRHYFLIILFSTYQNYSLMSFLPI